MGKLQLEAPLEEYLIGDFSICNIQLTLSNAITNVIGEGGLEANNTQKNMQLLHRLYNIQINVDPLQWKKILKMAI